MSPTPSPLNPSQAVERIREIIVGRHLERLEHRVARLETAPPASATPQGPASSSLEDRLCGHEARLEALQESVQRLADSNRLDSEQRTALQREEIQRLAAQIQQVAALKAAETAQPAVERLESRIGTWLSSWQSSLQSHLNERDLRLTTQLRGEVATLWESTESQLTRLESRTLDHKMIEERFSRIAAAARALAESASPTQTTSEYATL
jgi:small-conductance mechanosensitive channel